MQREGSRGQGRELGVEVERRKVIERREETKAERGIRGGRARKTLAPFSPQTTAKDKIFSSSLPMKWLNFGSQAVCNQCK